MIFIGSKFWLKVRTLSMFVDVDDGLLFRRLLDHPGETEKGCHQNGHRPDEEGLGGEEGDGLDGQRQKNGECSCHGRCFRGDSCRR